MKPLISVIVPVYNVEKYLEKCVDSIINQTYSNLEIILVNDGSPDNCPQICDEYAKKDKRIKVIHKKNGGQADARNKALDIMQGEWVVFIDSDDFVEKDFIETLYELCFKFDTKMSMINFRSFTDEREILDKKPQINEKESLITCEKMLYKMCVGDIGFAVWKFLFHKDIFKNIRFPSGQIYEDIFIAFDVLNLSKKVAITNAIKYFYRVRIGSTVNSFNKKHLVGVDSVKRFASFVAKEYPLLKDATSYAICTSMLAISIGILNSKESAFYDKLKEYSNFMRLNLKSVLKTDSSSKQSKILIIIFALSPAIFKIILKIYKRLK